MTLKLYTCLGSGNAYKAELMLHLLDLRYEAITVNIPRGEQNKPEFLALTPFGQIPVLVDDAGLYTDSQAILCYLARAYGGAHADTWFPAEAAPLAHVMRWLSVAANEIQNGLTLARAIKRLGWARDYAGAVARGYKILGLMDAHLQDRDWLATGKTTVADIACYPYVLLAPEGGIDIAPYTHVNRWLRRVESIPRFWPMPRIPGLPAIPLVPPPPN